MTPPPAEGAPDVTEPDEGLYRDLLYLHALAPEYRDLDLSALPGYGDFNADSALRHLAEAPEGEVGVSARLAVLYDVARAHLHDHETLGDAYAVLAGSTLALKTGSEADATTPSATAPIDTSALIDDLTRSADAGLPFATTPSAGAFEHQETAFIGQSVCTVRRVRVNGIAATWIFSEFETDAPLAGVADWLDPQLGKVGLPVLPADGPPRRATGPGGHPAAPGRRRPLAGRLPRGGPPGPAGQHPAALQPLARRRRGGDDLRPRPQPRRATGRRPGLPAGDRHRGDPPGPGAQDRVLHRRRVGRRRAAGVPVLDRLGPRLRARRHEQPAGDPDAGAGGRDVRVRPDGGRVGAVPRRRRRFPTSTSGTR